MSHTSHFTSFVEVCGLNADTHQLSVHIDEEHKNSDT
jgi:hypothetical protein